jgi:hypothetical protein
VKNILKAEYIGLLALAIYLFTLLDYAWWVYAALFFLPDIGILGYLIHNRIGAYTYNILHHQGIAVVLYLGGVYLVSPALMLAGVVMLGHANFDRIFNYGLKYVDSFRHTHLGNIGD